MLIIEFDENILHGLNLLKYRNSDDNMWYYMYIDIETLNLLLLNFGIIATKRIPTQYICVDNPLTSHIVRITYCGAQIEMNCNYNNNSNSHLLALSNNN